MLSKDQERDLIRRAQRGDHAARDGIWVAFHQFAVAEARRLALQKATDPDEAEGEAAAAIPEAIDRFDSAPGCAFQHLSGPAARRHYDNARPHGAPTNQVRHRSISAGTAGARISGGQAVAGPLLVAQGTRLGQARAATERPADHQMALVRSPCWARRIRSSSWSFDSMIKRSGTLVDR